MGAIDENNSQEIGNMESEISVLESL